MINYDKASKTYDQSRTHSEWVIERLVKRPFLSKTSVVLDFGCGTGNYLYAIHKAVGCHCYGVEPSAGMRERAVAKNKTAVIRKGDHAHIPFADQTFDFVYMTDVIHHVPDLALLFGELWRVMQPGGSACIVTQSQRQINGRFYNRYFPSLASNEQQRYPTLANIVAYAQQAGFVHEEIETLVTATSATVTADFIQLVEGKNYSMFRLLDATEYQAGLAALKADLGKRIECPDAGDSLVWLRA